MVGARSSSHAAAACFTRSTYKRQPTPSPRTVVSTIARSLASRVAGARFGRSWTSRVDLAVAITDKLGVLHACDESPNQAEAAEGHHRHHRVHAADIRRNRSQVIRALLARAEPTGVARRPLEQMIRARLGKRSWARMNIGVRSGRARIDQWLPVYKNVAALFC